MDTKLKNSNSNDNNIENTEKIKKTIKINIYSKYFKIATIIFIYIISVVIFFCSKFLFENFGDYKNLTFNYEFQNYCYDTVDSKLNLQNEYHIQEFYEQRYKNKIEESTNETEKNNLSEEMTNIINSRISDLNRINYNLDNSMNFVYIIKDIKTGKIINTNIQNNPNIDVVKLNQEYIYKDNTFNNPIEILKIQSNYISFINGSTNGSVYNSNKEFNKIVYTRQYDINRLLRDINDINRLLNDINVVNQYELHFAIIEPIMDTSDIFYTNYMNRQKIVPVYNTVNIVRNICIVILIITILYIMVISGRNKKYGELLLNRVDKIYTDIHTLVIIFIAFMLIETFYSYSKERLILLCVFVPLGLNWLCSISRLYKAHSLLKTSLIYCILKKIYNFFSDVKEICEGTNKYQLFTFIFIIFSLVAINGFWYTKIIFRTSSFLYLLMIFLTIILNFIFILWIITSFIALKKINKATSKISSGDINYVINIEKFPNTFKPLVNDIANIQNGLSSAVDKAIKGERLKTELITNVSHDLKTPLTSIVNYVDLLKKEHLNNDKAESYLKILDEKSARLKQLIEDLIEASKASTGNLSVIIEKLDLRQLIMQAYGEQEAKLSKNSLDVRITSLENQIMIVADGNHMWRILSNLLSNVAKYALPNSRVYIDASKTSGYGVLTIKNVSAQALEISPKQLTERFVRGDDSRITEGSGLGLAITQSLTQLQNGVFTVETDGDLFKVTLEIPLWKE